MDEKTVKVTRGVCLTPELWSKIQTVKSSQMSNSTFIGLAVEDFIGRMPMFDGSKPENIEFIKRILLSKINSIEFHTADSSSGMSKSCKVAMSLWGNPEDMKAHVTEMKEDDYQ